MSETDWGATPGQKAKKDDERVTDNIVSLNQRVKELNSLVNQLGTSKDGKELRQQLQTKRDDIKTIVIETKNVLHRLISETGKTAKLDKLNRQYQDVVSEYDRICKLSLRKEKEIVSGLEESYSRKNSASTGSDMPLNLQEIQMEDVEKLLIEERNQAIRQMEKDLAELSDCFIDMAEEVNVQGGELNVVETNASNSAITSKEGVRDLEKCHNVSLI